MFDIGLWREIFQSMSKNKLRSLLSGFTVSFAILLFTLLFGIANGLENTFVKLFKDDATNAMFIFTGRTTMPHKGFKSGRKIQFTNNENEFLQEEFGDKIEYITSKIYKNFSVSYKNKKHNYQVIGAETDYQPIEKALVYEGRFITAKDLKEKSKVAIIGRLVAEDLFEPEVALGKYINVQGISYKVVGVYRDDGGDDVERLIYIPLSTAQQVYGSTDNIDQINITHSPNMDVDAAKILANGIEAKLKKRFNIAPLDQRAIRIYNIASQSGEINQMTMGLGILIIVIGMGTLIAGVVGIANIMIFVVKERTKELGIRKALGATPRSIVRLIMFESVLVTAIAGYIGLLIGMGSLALVGDSLKEYFITNPSVNTSLIVTATIVLIIAGAIAGYVPAKRASRIKPIIALRDE